MTTATTPQLVCRTPNPSPNDKLWRIWHSDKSTPSWSTTKMSLPPLLSEHESPHVALWSSPPATHTITSYTNTTPPSLRMLSPTMESARRWKLASASASFCFTVSPPIYLYPKSLTVLPLTTLNLSKARHHGGSLLPTDREIKQTPQLS